MKSMKKGRLPQFSDFPEGLAHGGHRPAGLGTERGVARARVGLQEAEDHDTVAELESCVADALRKANTKR